MRAPDGKHQRAIERRIKHLERRTTTAIDPLSFDLQELEALRTSLSLIQAHRQARELPLATLLLEAADALEGNATEELPEALVLALRQRAGLIDALGGI